MQFISSGFLNVVYSRVAIEFRDTRFPFRLTNNPTPGMIKLVGVVFRHRQARNLVGLAQSVTGF